MNILQKAKVTAWDYMAVNEKYILLNLSPREYPSCQIAEAIDRDQSTSLKFIERIKIRQGLNNPPITGRNVHQQQLMSVAQCDHMNRIKNKPANN